MGHLNGAKFEAVARAVATGHTLLEASAQHGVNYRTARGWSTRVDFKAKVAAIQAELFDAFIGAATGALKEAVTGMLQIAREGAPDSTRLSAWRGVIDDMLRVRSTVKLERDVEELRARLTAIEGEPNADTK